MSIDKAEEYLQNALVTTFFANLAFLSEYDNDLYHRVDVLSNAINNNEYKENYCLEFLKEDGDFDIYDIKNDKYLYDKKASKYNRNAHQKTDFTSKGSISILDLDFFQGNYFPDLFEEVEYFCNFEFAAKKLVNDIFPYVNILKNNISDFKFKKFKYISKFIFLGTSGGRHIPLILDKTKANNYFVCEKNLEIFRLSLFTVDYSNLARDGKTVVFSIMDNSSVFNNKINRFLSNDSYENYLIKYFSTDYDISEYYDGMMNAVLSQKSISFNHHMMLDNLWKNISHRINKYKVLQLNKIDEKCISNLPVLFLGAGPSLLDNIDWVVENQEKFIIVAMGATYQTLHRYGIKSHIITSLDPQYTVLNEKHFDINNIKKMTDSYTLAAINTDQRILDRFNQDKLYLFEVTKAIHSNNICSEGYSVGEITASLLINLKFKNIYLLGLDFALNQNTGSSHMEGYSSLEYTNSFKELKHKDDSNNFTFDEELIEIDGNHQDKVYTNRQFSLSLNSLSSNINLKKEKYQNIYNLSNHGAKIENTISILAKDVELSNFKDIEFKTIDKDLNNLFMKSSKSNLSNIDQETIIKEIDYYMNIQKEITELKKECSSTFIEFKDRINIISRAIVFSKYKNSYAPVIFSYFFNMILQYVYYSFNDQKIKNEKKKIKKIEEIFLNQTDDLLGKYIKYTKQILEPNP